MERFGGMTWEDLQALMKAGDTVVVAHEDGPMVVMPLWRYRALLEVGESVGADAPVRSEVVHSRTSPGGIKLEVNPKSDHPVSGENVGKTSALSPVVDSASIQEREVTPSYKEGIGAVYSPVGVASEPLVGERAETAGSGDFGPTTQVDAGALRGSIPQGAVINEDVESSPEYDQEAVEAAISAAQAKFSSDFQGKMEAQEPNSASGRRNFRGEEAFYLR